jgi:FkbM family methyltransferase
MSWQGGFVRKALLPAAEAILGRRNLVRLGRLITMQARLDIANDMACNGELMVQATLLLRSKGSHRIIVFDVGANKGDWTSALLRQAGQAPVYVHLFEPASRTYSLLRDKLQACGSNVILVNQAMSDRQGTAELVIMGEGAGTNSLCGDRTQAKAIETVRLNTIDHYCTEHDLKCIDLIKIDAEGHDMSVLRGASSMLEKQAIGLVQFEYNQRWIDSRQLLKDAFEFLLPKGYSLGKVTPKGIEFYPDWHFELESFREGNYLACTRQWQDLFPKVRWWNL